MGRTTWVVAIAACLLGTGCRDDIQNQVKDGGNNIFDQQTDAIEEFRNADHTEADRTVEATPLYALDAAGNMLGDIGKAQVDQALNFFHVEHERYPESHEEFMAEVIKANGIKLPMLPADRRYAYDVENHELKVIANE